MIPHWRGFGPLLHLARIDFAHRERVACNIKRVIGQLLGTCSERAIEGPVRTEPSKFELATDVLARESLRHDFWIIVVKTRFKLVSADEHEPRRGIPYDRPGGSAA